FDAVKGEHPGLYQSFDTTEAFDRLLLDNLQRLLLEYGEHLQGKPLDPAVVQALAPKPRDTLPTQPFFFGREKELAIIAEAISPESRTWGALIDGPGGIGKTALAVRAGRLAPAADYPRKVFLSAKVRELTSEGEQKLEDFMLPNYVALITELGREPGDPHPARRPVTL